MFLLDTVVTIDSDLSSDELTDVLAEVSEAADECYNKPFDEIGSTLLTDMFAKGEILRETYGEEIDFRIGALTRLWNISKGTSGLPSSTEIQAALEDKSFYDPGAIAKGYALDQAYKTLAKTNSKYTIISAESSILLYGEKPGGELWKTAVKDPLTPGSYIGYIETEAVFISTSGNSERFIEIEGERYGHIIDTETGYPAKTDLAAVTVIVPTDVLDGGIMSDFLSTLIFMRGTAGLDTFLGYDGFTFIAIDNTGKVYGNQELFPID